MASRDFLKHVVSITEPTSLSLGDEWYNPTTNRLYKRVATNGTLVEWSDITVNSARVSLGGGNIATNTAVGFEALGGANTGIGFNTAIGYQALKANTIGVRNTAIGAGALEVLTGGVNNTAIGRGAMGSSQGSECTVIGNGAGGSAGNNCVVIGHSSGGKSNGARNTVVGSRSDVANLGDVNSIVLGGDCFGLGSNTTVIGNASTTQARIFGTLEPTGDITIKPGVTTGSATITTPTTELVLSQTGDLFGSSTLRLQNRNGVNGAMFDCSGATFPLVDFVFKTANGQKNIRYETRSGANEFQIGNSNGPQLLVADFFVKVNPTTAATSTTSGALQVAGGAGIAGALHVGALGTGSSGLNISNGNTVTGITRVATGSGYTSAPTVNIAVPTTAGGVQATAIATVSMLASPGLISGGLGYAVNDVLTVVGGTLAASGGFPAQIIVSAVNGSGTILNYANFIGNYSVPPLGTITVTGGFAGNNGAATFNSVASMFGVYYLNMLTAGSGYIEQPAVTFSGGGGSGATAYATVGSIPTVKTLGSALSFNTPSGEAFRVSDIGVTSGAYWNAYGGTSTPELRSVGSGSAVISTSGTNQIQFRTNTNATQAVVSHTGSAVNFVQVTGAAQGGSVIISAQGSDTNVGLQLRSRGVGDINLMTQGGTNQVVIRNISSAVNFLSLKGASGTTVPIEVEGFDPNINLALTPKGTGSVILNGRTTARIVPRVSTTTSSATPTINTDNIDQYGLTAQAVDITSFTTNLTGTPTDGQKLWIYIVGTAARAITWGASFEASSAALPTTTVTTNRLDVGFVWNVATSKWRCVAVA